MAKPATSSEAEFIFVPEASRSIEVSTVFDAAANARFSPGVSLLSESEKVITSRPIKRKILGKKLIHPQLLIKAAKMCRIEQRSAICPQTLGFGK